MRLTQETCFPETEPSSQMTWAAGVWSAGGICPIVLQRQAARLCRVSSKHNDGLHAYILKSSLSGELETKQV